MPGDTLSCPYCNSLIALPPTSLGQPFFCPRCGEAFPERLLTGTRTGIPATRTSETGAVARTGWPNWAVAVVTLVGMALIALMALTVFLLTQEMRRQHDVLIVKPPRGRQGFERIFRENLWVFVIILTWAVSLVLVIRWRKGFEDELPTAQPAPSPSRRGLMKTLVGLWCGVGLVLALGAALAVWNRPSPSELPPSISPHHVTPPAKLPTLGYLPADTDVIAAMHVADAADTPTGKDLFTQLSAPLLPTPANVEKWTGMTPAELDHVVLGARFVPGLLLPRLVIVVKTLKPYDRDKVVAALRKAPWSTSAYRLATEDVIILGFASADLEAVPETPRAGIDHLSEPLRDFLEERLTKGSQLWLIGHVAEPAPILQMIPDKSLSEQERNLLKDMSAFGFGVQLGTDATMQGQVECRDSAAAAKLDKYLARWEKNGVKHVHEPDSDWVHLQSRGQPERFWKNWSETTKDTKSTK